MMLLLPVYRPRMSSLVFGLIGWWPFDNLSGRDFSSLNNNLTITAGNSVTFAGGTAPGIQNLTKGAISLPLNTNVLTNFVATSKMTGAASLSAATLAAWVYQFNGLGTSYGHIISTRKTGLLVLGLCQNASSQKVWIDWDGTHFSDNTGITITNNVWTHLVATFGNSTITVYKNGLKVFSESATLGTQNEDGVWKVGVDANNGTCLNCLVDDARVYNRALSAGEILALYSEAFQPLIDIETIALTQAAQGGGPVIWAPQRRFIRRGPLVAA